MVYLSAFPIVDSIDVICHFVYILLILLTLFTDSVCLTSLWFAFCQIYIT